MRRNGLTAQEQERLITQEGVDTAEAFQGLRNEDFLLVGIDIEERRTQKAEATAERKRREKEELESKMKQDQEETTRRSDVDQLETWLETDGERISADGRALLEEKVPNLRRLFALEKREMKALGMKVVDITSLHKLLESSGESTLQKGRKNLPKLRTARGQSPLAFEREVTYKLA